MLEREADLASDPNEVISYRYRIAELWHHRLGDPERAIDIYRDILEVLPGTRAHAKRTRVDHRRRSRTARVRPAFSSRCIGRRRSGPNWSRFTRCRSPMNPTTCAKWSCCTRWRSSRRLSFRTTRPRLARMRARFRSRGDNEQTLGSLERLAEQLGRWAEVTRLYDAELAALRERAPDTLVDMALRTAQIFEVQLGDVDAAIERYRMVVEVDEVHVQAIESLDRLYEATERWAELAATSTARNPGGSDSRCDSPPAVPARPSVPRASRARR